jgi:hypothetical protein
VIKPKVILALSSAIEVCAIFTLMYQTRPIKRVLVLLGRKGNKVDRGRSEEGNSILYKLYSKAFSRIPVKSQALG